MPKDQAYREAEKKIEAALKTGTTELDLNGMKLTELPESIGQLTQLQLLNLSNNQLTTLPESMGGLMQLQSLTLSFNQLMKLPDSLGKLTQLQSLALSKNQLTIIPEWLKNLTQLQALGLSYNNKLKSLPEWLGELTQLQELNLQGLQLDVLPETIGNLKQLQTLTLRNMKLREIPEWIGKFSHLYSLNLAKNQLIALPESLGQLTQLHSIKLAENQLIRLPESMGKCTKLRSLDLSNNQLTTLPDSLSQLTQLTSLDLSDNQLTSLPDWLRQLTQLTELNLSRNQLITLPETIGQLANLTDLDLFQNQLTTLPEFVGKLTKLTKINLAYNPLTTLPETIGKLIKLSLLYINDCQLATIPETIGNLTNLKEFLLDSNQLVTLPEAIGKLTKLTILRLNSNQFTDLPFSLAQLEHLEYLNLDDNPLNPALQSANDACLNGSYEGYEPLWAYLRSIEKDAEPLYEAKLVLVGEGGVGKTTLLKALMKKEGHAPQKGEATTHGVKIDIDAFKLPHPDKEDVQIQLNSWDFGGQRVYRVTHQFFFSPRSIYILVWHPRIDVKQSRVEEWLKLIRLRVGKNARVIIVSTHCQTGEHIARIDKPVFERDFGSMIVDFIEVDSLVDDPESGDKCGVVELKKLIADAAAELEQMGMAFNINWKAARDELIELGKTQPRINYSEFVEVCSKHSLSEIDTSTLIRLMHDLGYIVYYGDDERLKNDVVLQPEWLTKAIGFVLEDRETEKRDGILPDTHLRKVWLEHKFANEPKYRQNSTPSSCV